MKPRLILAIAACCVGLSFAQNPADPASDALSVDPIVNWKDPLSVTNSALLETLARFATDGNPCYQSGTSSTGGAVVTITPESAAPRAVVGFGEFPVEQLSVTFGPSEAASLSLLVLPTAEGKSARDAIVSKLSELIGHLPNKGKVRYRSGSEYDSSVWSEETFRVLLHEKDLRTIISVMRPTAGSTLTPTPGPATNSVAVDLDAFLTGDTFWKWTTQDFERQYVPAREKNETPPQFEWLSSSKERARFSRKLFNNLDTKLTMFGGSVKVEEAIVEFVNGRAARATVSFYNRGDSGEIRTQDFEAIFKRIGQNLGQALKVAPKSQLGSSNAALKVTGWNWTTPKSIALLEYNDYTTRNSAGGSQQPEFLRLKLAAADHADFTMGRLGVGVGRMAAARNVTKSPAGDVYIDGVPMVDQGAKGYCVAASCQRLFEYFQIPCDQHELANLVSIDADSGANPIVMQKSLAKIDGRFNVSFKPYVNPELYYDKNRKRRVSFKEFAGLVKEHTDKGTPMLWALILGEFPEEPPLKGSGQVRGGHMRLIIGYNSAKNQVLFTDSWGAGHELKRMDAANAYECTLGLYSMSPRGL